MLMQNKVPVQVSLAFASEIYFSPEWDWLLCIVRLCFVVIVSLFVVATIVCGDVLFLLDMW